MEYMTGAQRNAVAGNPQKKLAIKRTECARSMLQLGRLDSHIACAWEDAALDMLHMLPATTVRS